MKKMLVLIAACSIDMRLIGAVVATLLACGVARALVRDRYSMELIPPNPAPGELIRVRGDFRQTLYVEPYIDLTRDGTVVRMTMYFGDFSDGPQVREWTLGRFDAGIHRVDYYAQAAVRLEDAPPVYQGSDLFVVGNVAMPVPALSSASALLAICGILLFARWARPRA